ncbi:MAG: c-type cytochrome [Cellvibrionaceae bacterium]
MKNLLKPASVMIGALIGVLAFSNGAVAQGDATAGKAKTTACAACHGADGNSPAAIYPSIAGLGEKYLLKQLQDIQSEERAIPEMTGQLNAMSDQDLQNIAAFYAGQNLALTGAKALTVKLNSGEETDGLKLGEALYRFGNVEVGVPSCTGCHSPTGQGNAPAGYPRLGGQHADYIAKQLKAFRGGERVNDGEQMTMRAIASRLSDAEIASVSAYIAGLH